MSQITNNIINLCITEPKPISQIVKLLQKNYNTVYSTIQRAVKKGLLTTKIIDGFLWVRTVPPKQPLNLLRGTQNSNKPAKIDFQNQIPICGPERYEAIQLTRSRIEMQSIQDSCTDLFDNYNERVSDAIISLLPDPEHDFLGPPLELPYKTRFNDEGRKVEQLKNYERAWDTAAARYRTAIMITLTTDPKIQASLWDANRKQAKNLNRLLSHLSRDYGARPTYINVNEFQPKNGRIHLHLVIFGKSYIMPMRKLSALWDKYGQGSIVHFHKLRKDQDGAWTWDRQKPKDTKGKSPIDYLKKYLKKGLFDETNYQFWIYNTRFFTNSRKLLPKKLKKLSRHHYYFFGVFYDLAPEYGKKYQEVIEKTIKSLHKGKKPGGSYTEGYDSVIKDAQNTGKHYQRMLV